MQVQRDTIIGDILDYDESCTKVFESFGMFCVQCPASRAETVGEACEVHGVDPETVIDQLNAELKKT
jgi:hybrid cluster-associated redox disulfide protein